MNPDDAGSPKDPPPPPPPPPQVASASPAKLPPASRRWVRLLMLGLAVLIAVLTLLSVLQRITDNRPGRTDQETVEDLTEIHNRQQLEASVRAAVIADDPTLQASTRTLVNCTPDGPRHYSCFIDQGPGNIRFMSVTVGADGVTWKEG
ncbi:MAG: hypothetical protein QG671_4492 [Actinomycetota bacterium]|nr:hypothetical protein [Actinomycetota bacterium]HQZ85462.1 hypothetical protein [Actinomycetota bacterium]